VEGELDTRRLLGRPSPDRVGYKSLTARVKIDCDLPREEQEKLLHEIDARCPISDNLLNVTPIHVTLAG